MMWYCFEGGVRLCSSRTAHIPKGVAWGIMRCVCVPALQLLLGYLPPDRGQWEAVLARKRAAYQHFVEELIIDPKKAAGASAEADHPLSQSSDSRWNAFFKASASLAWLPGVPQRAAEHRLIEHRASLCTLRRAATGSL